MSETRNNLIGLDRNELRESLALAGVPENQQSMRCSQLWNWLYVRGVSDFSEMLNLSKDLRAELEKHFSIQRPEVVTEQISKDGTRKWLLRFGSDTPDSQSVEIETVFIPEPDRGTLCVSSQVGCSLTCTFCHTGTQKMVRNLTASEILAQVLAARDRLADHPTGEEIGVGLAISLHATTDELRDVLVPINRKYPLEKLLEACRVYPTVSNTRRITFEYVMLDGVNDSIADARRLVQCLSGIPAKINLIPFNPWPGSNYECSSKKQIDRFANYLNDHGYVSPIRRPRGQDIMAACGQLKSESERAKRQSSLIQLKE